MTFVIYILFMIHQKILLEKIKALKLNIYTIPYNDKGFSYEIENKFISGYNHF